MTGCRAPDPPLPRGPEDAGDAGLEAALGGQPPRPAGLRLAGERQEE